MTKAALPRVVFLSSTKLGQELLVWLRQQPCDIVLAETSNRKIAEFGEYDFGLAFLYTHRIPASELTRPFRWVNFHPGPLPEYRGRNLAYHAIMEGAPEFGATIHCMAEEFDTGDIIEVLRFPIEPEDTAGDLVVKSHEALARLFRKHVPQLLQGPLSATPQGKGRYFPKAEIDEQIHLTESQARQLRAVTVAPRFHAKIFVGKRCFRILPEDSLRPATQDDSGNADHEAR